MARWRDLCERLSGAVWYLSGVLEMIRKGLLGIPVTRRTDGPGGPADERREKGDGTRAKHRHARRKHHVIGGKKTPQ